MLARRSTLTSWLLGAVLSILCFAASAVICPGQAQAAEEAPLRLVFLNSDPSDGTEVYVALNEVLEASDDLVLIDPEDLLDAASARGLSLDTFRKGQQRKRHAGTFQRVMEDVDAEGILVLDVFESGDTLQLVVIGPYGNELDDIRQSFSGGSMNQNQSIEVLKQVFRALVPEVRAHREWRREQQRKQGGTGAQVNTVDDPASDSVEDDSIRQRVIREHKREHADLNTGLTPRAGVNFGSRALTLQTETDYNLSHGSPFVGFGAEVDAIFALLDSETAAIGATLFGAYAPFTTVLTHEGDPLELPSSFSNAGLDLKYIWGLAPGWLVYAKVGAELMTIDIAQNQAYTGNQYINARAGVGVLHRFGRLAELQLDAAALPTLTATMSDEQMGPADFGVGFNGGARLRVTYLEPIRASIGYDFQYYQVTFASPALDELGGTPASITDMYHLASVMVGYGF